MNLESLNLISSGLVRGSASKFLSFAQKVAFFSIFVGSLALVLSLSILNGFDDKLRETAKKFTSDLAIYTINNEPINNIEEYSAQILKMPNVCGVSPVVSADGLISTKTFTEGVAIQSIDTDVSYRNFDKNIVAGGFSFSSDIAKEIIIGEELATKLSVSVGDKVLIYALKSNENISFSSASYAPFEIKAIYRTGMLQYDGTVVFAPFNSLAHFLELPQGTATYFEVYTKEAAQVDELATLIEDKLGYPFFPLTYYEMNQSIFAWIELQKEPIPLILGIISIVAILNIVTTLIIAVVEKTHSIGILQTIGLERKKLVAIFVFQGVKSASVASLSGTVFAVILTYLQNTFKIIRLDSSVYFLDLLPIKLELHYCLIVIGITLFFAFLASFIPALIATRISPIRAIKFS